MLANAYLYKEAIDREMTKISRDPFFDNLNGSFFTYKQEIQDSNWSKHQFVSIENGFNVVGYFEAGVERAARYIDSLVLVNFKKGWNPTFSSDLKEFILCLFLRYNYNKITFDVVVGTRNEVIYDKFVKRYGGRIVGTFFKHKMLQSGRIVDCKYYEITNEDFRSKVRSLHPNVFSENHSI